MKKSIVVALGAAVVVAVGYYAGKEYYISKIAEKWNEIPVTNGLTNVTAIDTEQIQRDKKKLRKQPLWGLMKEWKLAQSMPTAVGAYD